MLSYRKVKKLRSHRSLMISFQLTEDKMNFACAAWGKNCQEFLKLSRTLKYCLLKHCEMLTSETFAYFFTSHTCPFIKVGRSRKMLPRRYYRLVYVVLIIFSDICSYFTFFYAENLFLSIRRQDTISLLPDARALAIFSNFLFSH